MQLTGRTIFLLQERPRLGKQQNNKMHCFSFQMSFSRKKIPNRHQSQTWILYPTKPTLFPATFNSCIYKSIDFINWFRMKHNKSWKFPSAGLSWIFHLVLIFLYYLELCFPWLALLIQTDDKPKRPGLHRAQKPRSSKESDQPSYHNVKSPHLP